MATRTQTKRVKGPAQFTLDLETYPIERFVVLANAIKECPATWRELEIKSGKVAPVAVLKVAV